VAAARRLVCAGGRACKKPPHLIPPTSNIHHAKKNKQEEWRGEVIRLSWKPRAFLFKRFLSEAECDHIIAIVRFVSFSGVEGGGMPRARARARAAAAVYEAAAVYVSSAKHNTHSSTQTRNNNRRRPPAQNQTTPQTPQSRASLTKSTVVDQATGKPMDSNVRTSKGTFYQRGHDDIIKRIEERVAQVTMVPVENQEGLQVLHYTDGEKYGACARFRGIYSSVVRGCLPWLLRL
jgi:hypothetical protein